MASQLQLDQVRDTGLRRPGPLDSNDRYGWVRISPVYVPLTGRESEIVLAGYVEDDAMQDFEQAVDNLLSLEHESLRFCERWVFEYYLDARATRDDGEVLPPLVASPTELWSHVQFGQTIVVARRAEADRAVYVSIESTCDWEPERGLQLVFRKGERITKVGPCDGHLSNADAFGRPGLDHIVYVRT